MKYLLSKLAVASLLIAMWSCQTPDEAPQIVAVPFTTYQPVVVDTSLVFTYVADIAAQRHVELRPKVAGFVHKFFVDEGAKVSKNQLILKINSQEFEQHLLKAQAGLMGASADFKSKALGYEKTRDLFALNIVSDAELAVAKAAMDAAQAAVNLAESEVRNAQLNLSYTEIRAPFNGFINNINFRSGSLVNEDDVLTTISKTDSVFVYFNVSEKEYLELSVNREIYQAPVTLILADGSVYPFTGKVEIIEGTIDQITGSISFRAKFTNSNFLLKHGGSGRVAIPRQLNQAFLIAQKSTFEVQDKVFVFVVDTAGVVRQQAVNIDKRLPKLFSLNGGLAPNEQVLFEGVQLVKAGDTIAIQPAPLFDLLQR